MNPVDAVGISNYWLSCVLINPEALSETTRSGRKAVYKMKNGKSCPTEILEALNAFNAEGRPIWKPMHLQPIYRNNGFVTVDGNGRGNSNAYIKGDEDLNVASDIFDRGFCLPSDNKMSVEQQEVVVDIIHRCFGG